MAGSGDREALAVRTPDGEQVALALARQLSGTALVGGVRDAGVEDVVDRHSHRPRREPARARTRRVDRVKRPRRRVVRRYPQRKLQPRLHALTFEEALINPIDIDLFAADPAAGVKQFCEARAVDGTGAVESATCALRDQFENPLCERPVGSSGPMMSPGRTRIERAPKTRKTARSHSAFIGP